MGGAEEVPSALVSRRKLHRDASLGGWTGRPPSRHQRAAAAGGWSRSVFRALDATGRESESFDDAGAALRHIASEFNAGKAVVVNIETAVAGSPLEREHAYMVDSIIYDATGAPIEIVLRNPWGSDGAGVLDGIDDGFVTVTGQQLVDSMYGYHGIESAWV